MDYNMVSEAKTLLTTEKNVDDQDGEGGARSAIKLSNTATPVRGVAKKVTFTPAKDDYTSMGMDSQRRQKSEGMQRREQEQRTEEEVIRSRAVQDERLRIRREAEDRSRAITGMMATPGTLPDSFARLGGMHTPYASSSSVHGSAASTGPPPSPWNPSAVGVHSLGGHQDRGDAFISRASLPKTPTPTYGNAVVILEGLGKASVVLSYPEMLMETAPVEEEISNLMTMEEENQTRGRVGTPILGNVAYDALKRLRRTTAMTVYFRSTKTGIIESAFQRKVRGIFWSYLGELFAQAVENIKALFVGHPTPYDVTGVVMAYTV
jgi:hypothetical protein